jgi:hypothetical protein
VRNVVSDLVTNLRDTTDAPAFCGLAGADTRSHQLVGLQSLRAWFHLLCHVQLLLLIDFTLHATLSTPVAAGAAPPTVVTMFGLVVPKVATIIAAAELSNGTMEALGCAASDPQTTSVGASELPMLSTITVPARNF